MMKKILLAGVALATICSMSFTYQTLTQKDFTGLWELVSVESITKDGTVTYPYGEKPSGRMMIDKDGNYMVEIYTINRAKIVSGNKNTATPEENAMLVKGSNAHYGKFVADVNAKTLLFKPEAAFFPNWEAQDLQSTFSLENGTLKSYSANTTFGSAKAIVTWQKRK
jgi:hypothetical protein